LKSPIVFAVVCFTGDASTSAADHRVDV